MVQHARSNYHDYAFIHAYMDFICKGKDHALMKIDDILVIPNPPVKGQKIDIKADLELRELKP